MSCCFTTAFAKQRCIWLAWPHDTTKWPNDCIPAQKEFAALCMALSMSAPVFVLVPKKDLGRASFIIPHHINLIEVPDSPIDFDEISLVSKGEQIFVLSRGKVWSPKLESTYQLWHDKYQVQRESVDLVWPQGGFLTDGSQLFVALASLWLKVNLKLTLKDIEALLNKDLGFTDFVWLATKDMNQAIPRLDSLCTIRSDGTVLVSKESDPMIASLTEELSTTLDGRLGGMGRRFTVYQIPAVDNFELCRALKSRAQDSYAYPTYASVLPMNERLLVPLYGTARDNQILDLMMNIFKDLDVTGVEVKDITSGHILWHTLGVGIPALKKRSHDKVGSTNYS